jgi:tRNA (guanosine-2'-O-)-methyltransferase
MLKKNRIARMEETLRRKQPDLQLFCDNVHSSQNLSAILRSCDGVGILHFYYAVDDDMSLRIHKTITQGAHRWVERKRIDTSRKLSFLKAKKKEGFRIVVAHLDRSAVSFREVDYTLPTMIVMGNEKDGVSPEVLSVADQCVEIPMMGLVQSLNVSVATALILYEAQRVRDEAGMYDTPRLDASQREHFKSLWLYRDVVVRRSKGWILA